MIGVDALHRIVAGVPYSVTFLQETWLILLAAGMGVILRPSRPKTLLATLVLLMFGYGLYVGGDWLSRWRFVSPVMPFALILMVCGLIEILRYLVGFHWLGKLAVVVTLMAIFLTPTALPYIEEITFNVRAEGWATNVFSIEHAVILNRILTSDAAVAVHAAGTVPYYSRASYGVDLLGKMDVHIANATPYGNWLPGHNKSDFAYAVTQRQPTYLMMCNWGQDSVCDYVDSHYVFPQIFGLHRSINLYLLKDSPDVRWECLADIFACEPLQ